MRIILDNNIYFSLMKPDSTASQIFGMFDIEFVAPEFLKTELKRHDKECQNKSGLSKKEYELRKKTVNANIAFYDIKSYRSFLNKALKMVSDPDDAPYLAFALKINSPIWSNDKHLKKQSVVPILTTKELIELIDF